MTYADKYLKDEVDVEEFYEKLFIIHGVFNYYGTPTIKLCDIRRWLNSQAKPNLTEDEKVILRNINKKYKVILRQHNNIWIMEDHDGEKIYHGYCLDYYESNLFKFIQERRRI